MAVQLQEARLSDEYLLVLTTCSDQASAQQLATRLIDGRLAACVNIIPGIESVYRWHGDIERGQEVLLLIKTGKAQYGAVEATIQTCSHYELPEILAVPVAGGSDNYLNWISAALGSSTKD
jgi:periplasmic divalent cation tolerance protein